MAQLKRQSDMPHMEIIMHGCLNVIAYISIEMKQAESIEKLMTMLEGDHCFLYFCQNELGFDCKALSLELAISLSEEQNVVLYTFYLMRWIQMKKV
ncbi:hypothetical protein PAALTS15_19213 [Paenibacillus alvei TS-15]|uniref:Uncharacterized protein n=2 Tax=Paenibacillus alvei TaxID=44250 RepID=S9SLX2_PAEAL|nr:hypothetical protein [Paenibacillus alvei]EPY05689.1 hypothetical protein PAALTS15_19213 [Paenibacillus alvei TS-15]